jgi:recombination protein RecT
MQNKKYDITTIKGFTETLIKYKESIRKFLNPKYGITPEDFIETCIRVVREMPKLLQCDPKSLFGSILFCAEIGLKPNTPQGHAYILPYKGQAKFQIGYKGLIEIMYRNPRVKGVNAIAVYENDDFSYGYGLKPFLNHIPARKNKGNLDCVYAHCLVDDVPLFVVIEKEELDAIRNISPSFNSEFSAYTNGLDIHNWMEKKAGIKALSKIVPTTNNSEISKAVEYDSKFEGGARAFVELPENENEIVEPKLLGGDFKYKTIENAFDSFEDESSTQKLEISQAPEPVKEHFEPIKEQMNVQNQEIKIPVNQPVEKPIEFKTPTKEVSEPIKQETNLNNEEESSIEFELPIAEDNDFQEQDNFENDSSENNSFEKKKVDSNFQWDLPNDDEDDDDYEPQSTLF